MNQRVRDTHKRQRKEERECRKNREQTMRRKAKIVADHKRRREETQ